MIGTRICILGEGISPTPSDGDLRGLLLVFQTDTSIHREAWSSATYCAQILQMHVNVKDLTISFMTICLWDSGDSPWADHIIPISLLGIYHRSRRGELHHR